MNWTKLKKIDKFFLTQENPYTKRRNFQAPAAKWLIGAAILGFIFFVLAYPDTHTVERTKPVVAVNLNEMPSQAAVTTESDFYEDRQAVSSRPSQRQYTASQVVRPGASSLDSDKLPMGTTIPAKLTIKSVSTDSDSPVVGEVTDDIYWKNSLFVPQETKVIGAGVLDETTERLKCRFHTLVYPDGSQHQISALAMQFDGSSGLSGDYHRGELKKYAGKVFDNFVGGVAQGLKEREYKNYAGPLEAGNLRNGLLNGVTTASFDHAKSRSDEVKNVRPFLEVSKGTVFQLYLEKEYAP